MKSSKLLLISILVGLYELKVDSFTFQAKRIPTFYKQLTVTKAGDQEHSFVEGDVFEDRYAEIEAMGGDPFFLDLDDDESDKKDDEGESVEYDPTDGFGPQRKEEDEIDPDEWDGWEIEGAHFD